MSVFCLGLLFCAGAISHLFKERGVISRCSAVIGHQSSSYVDLTFWFDLETFYYMSKMFNCTLNHLFISFPPKIVYLYYTSGQINS